MEFNDYTGKYFFIVLMTHRILMFVANRYRCHNVMNRHTALLAGAVLEAALSEEMLLLARPENVLGAMVRVENRFIRAIFKLAGLERSLETEARVLLDSLSHQCHLVAHLHLFFRAI